ncbi:MAG: ribosomal L7Ae/L30e/S12e/Gadd45 family protein [Dethiobacter sp.]|jgi:large subunit ribosomal protein L7A|nr:ribosomal L7Ae/L30e/S12e/Gadd45 family protein [Dethiobacter sp.]
MELDSLKQAKSIVTGTKQTLKAVQTGKAKRVFVARDADERVLRLVLDMCEEKNVPVSFAEKMEGLGKACGIKVKAATAAIVSED